LKKANLPDLQPLDLLGGLKDLSHLRPVREEAAVVKAIRADGDVASKFLAEPTSELLKCWRSQTEFPASNLIRPFINKWRWLAPRTLEILQARWHEDPSPVFDSIKRSLAADDVADVQSTEISQMQAFSRAQSLCHAVIAKNLPILSTLNRKGFDDSLQTTRSLLWLREELRMHSTRMYSLIRTWTLDLGRRWQTRGIINKADDIFFLEWKTIIEYSFNETDIVQARNKIANARLYYNGFANYSNPDEIGSRWLATPIVIAANTPQLSGVGGSAGTYQGTARLISSVEEVGRLQKGDVLVTKFTDPGWTTAFADLGAVVTETGGVLSHAAVISREYGFPAVLAVHGAMSTIRDGEQIVVDGTTGVVHRVDVS
ncbi:MAG: PEP-utilizing enzyme, partial [Planctomycetota bacterium]|nr:PEP-utilizing enzyme [Planctomycetota bacterium]